MRQNARFRSSWEPGGDLITLTVRVAGAAVVNDVIGHCRPSSKGGVQVQVDQLGDYGIMGPNLGAKPLPRWGYSQHSSLVPDFSKSGTKTGRSLKLHGGEAWGRGVQGALGAYSGCILPSLVVSSLSRPRSLLFASCCLLFWRVFVRSLREHASFKEGSLRRLRSFILAIFASKDGRRS
jgi:hypothetical protein